MPRGKKEVDPKEMTPAEYEAAFGRRKPGPKAGARRGPKPKDTRASLRAVAIPGLKKDGTPKRKPGPKPTAIKAAKPTRTAVSSDAPWGYKKDGTPRKPPGRKASGASNGKQETLATATVPKRRGPKPSTKSGRAGDPVRGYGKAVAKDLGPPPPSRGKQFALIKEIIESELADEQLEELHGIIEVKLIGDTSDLTDEDLAAVAELQSSGYGKLDAFRNVRHDRQAETEIERIESVQAADDDVEDDDVEDDQEEEEDDDDVSVTPPASPQEESEEVTQASPGTT